MNETAIITKLIGEYGPVIGLLALAVWIFWRDFFKQKLNNNLNAENSMQQLLMNMGTKLIEELPQLREAMNGLTLHILEITAGQQEHAAQLAELKSKSEVQGQELKLYSNHFDKIYNKQMELNNANADSHASIINKLDSHEKKLDTILDKLSK